MKKYNIIAFDAQYFLFRNFAALKSRTAMDWVANLSEGEGNTSIGHLIKRYEFDRDDLVKQFFWTIAKLVRDHFSCNKIILLWDTGPYHKTILLDDYKGDRVHHSDELLDDWDIDSDPVGYLQEKEEVRIEHVKHQAISWIVDNLGSIGLPSVKYSGYEADDLAYILGQVYSSDQKNAICSVDSDWMYWITENTDFINFNKKEVWTYQDVIDECEGYPTDLGIDLFETKCFMDSLFYSHNGLQPTTNYGWRDFKTLVTEIKSGDFSKITDLKRYELNMKSFDIMNYPEIETVKSILVDLAEKPKIIVDMDSPEVNKLYSNGFQVSRGYLSKFLNNMNCDGF